MWSLLARASVSICPGASKSAPFRICVSTRRCDAWAAPSALMTAAWRCRKTSMVGAPHTRTYRWTFTADFKLVTLSFFHPVERQSQEEGAKRKRGPAKSVCPYNKALALQQMRDEVLGKVQDIEQLLKLGREIHSCPYYSTRLAIPPAQVTQSLPLPTSLCPDFGVIACWHLCFYLCEHVCFHSWWCCPIRYCFMKPQGRQLGSSWRDR